MLNCTCRKVDVGLPVAESGIRTRRPYSTRGGRSFSSLHFRSLMCFSIAAFTLSKKPAYNECEDYLCVNFVRVSRFLVLLLFTLLPAVEGTVRPASPAQPQEEAPAAQP